jgi:DNA-3-methyladenine glycosylase I
MDAKRCGWARTPLGIAYHDTEWGVPVHDDRTLFEFLTLEGAQAGLSWETILRKRQAYRDASSDSPLSGWRASRRHASSACLATAASCAIV